MRNRNENATVFTNKELQNGTKTLLANIGSVQDFCSLFDSSSLSASTNQRVNKRDQRKLTNACLLNLQKNASAFFDPLLSLVQASIREQDFVPEAAFLVENLQENDHDEWMQQTQTINMDAQANLHLQLFRYAADCVKIRLEQRQTLHHDSEWELCLALHDALHDLDPAWGEAAANASKAIVGLCEAAYLAKTVPSRESIILNALPALVEGALQTKSDLKRLYAIRNALTLIDFESTESKPFATLLLRLVSIPSCLKAPEGKRLVSYLLRIGLCRSIHRSIRAQIPGNKPSILKDYGEIYYQAWKECQQQDDQQDMIEREVYQDLIYASLHAAKPQLVQSLLHVLEPLHCHQNKTEVEVFLHRLYGPVLWRALSAANERVRANAVQVLGYVFPMRDKATGAKTTETTNPLARALEALISALQDDAPLVRVEASAATARILTNFWDVIPPREIRKLLNFLVIQHASDATSVAVRVGAVDSVAQLLETPSSHAILRELLPPLGNLIHDKAESVRLAVVKLLQRIKKVPNIKYYKIVPVHHLMARLVEEPKASNSSVATALTGLMVNSYAPESADAEQLVGRTQRFLTDYPRAAPIFYANLSKFRSPSLVCQLMVGLYHCLVVAMEALESQHNKLRRVGGKRSRLEDQNDEDSDSGDVDLGLCGTFVHVILVLWTSIKDDLDQSPEWTEFVASEVEAQSLIDMVVFLNQMGSKHDEAEEEDGEEEEQRIAVCNQSSKHLLQCAALLPLTAVETVAKTLPSQTETSKSPAYLALMSVWGFDIGRELVVSIASALGESSLATVETEISASSKKSHSEASQEIPAIRRMEPLAAVRAIGAILQGDDPSSIMARDSLIECESLFRELQRASECALQILSGRMGDRGIDKTFLLEACECFGRLVLHREAKIFIGDAKPALSSTVLLFLDWTDRVVSGLTMKCAPNVTLPFADPDLSAIKVDPSFIASPQSSTMAGGSRSIADGSATVASGQCWNQTTMAESLIASSCIVISEWLAVGGPGDDFFATKASGWCSSAGESLLLPYCRLAIQLTRQNGNTLLLKSIFDSYKGDLNESSVEIVRNTISFVLSTWAKAETIQSVVDTVLSAARSSLGEFHFEVVSDATCCVDVVWPFENGAVKAAIGAILRSTNGSREAVLQLTGRIKSITADDQHTMFWLHFLGMLGRLGSKVCDEASRAMRDLEREHLSDRAREMRDGFVGDIDNAMG